MNTEIWLPVPGFEERYEVSSHGRTRSVNGVIKAIGVFSNGYARTSFRQGGQSYSKRIHLLIAICFVDNPNNLPEVNHIDGNKLNNHFSNLEWVTRQENMDHAKATGLVWKHGQVNTAKLSLVEAQAIRAEYATGQIGQRPLARKYGVTKTAIKMIVSNRSWKV